MGRNAKTGCFKNKIIFLDKAEPSCKHKFMSSLFENIPASWQAGFALISQPILKRIGIQYDIDAVYKELGVGRTSAYDSARILLKNLNTPQAKIKEERKKNLALQKQLNEKTFLYNISQYRLDHPGCWIQGDRHQLSDEFKSFLLLQKNECKLDWPDISRLLGIPEDTLKKLKRQQKDDNDNGKPPLLPLHIIELISSYFKGRSGKSSVKNFCEKNPSVLVELNLNYRGFSKCLFQLGFINPKGIFLNNTGLDKIERFRPNCIWGTDGKQMNVIINGESFRWVWQCLIEYKTTVLVGGLIGKTENTENLLEAIKLSAAATGITPMAIVLDNRLSENLPAIKNYLDQFGITIIKTFPGNSKSNGIVEGNFNIFETWVGGKVEINGNNAEELSFSIANVLVQVFTQLRNHQPRKAFSNKSVDEVLNEALPMTDEERAKIQERIYALAARLKNEQVKPINSEQKNQAIAAAIETTKPVSPEIFAKKFEPSFFTADLILQAIAIFNNQKKKHPEKDFDHTYFGGIARNLAEQKSLETIYLQLEDIYTDHWQRMKNVLLEKSVVAENATEISSRLLDEYFKIKIPAHGTVLLGFLKNIFLLATRGSLATAQELRVKMSKKILKEKLIAVPKRELLLRKLFEFENLVHLVNYGEQKIFSTGPKVFKFDTEIAPAM